MVASAADNGATLTCEATSHSTTSVITALKLTVHCGSLFDDDDNDGDDDDDDDDDGGDGGDDDDDDDVVGFCLSTRLTNIIKKHVSEYVVISKSL